METKKQVWVAFKIWMIAVLLNAICGTAIISNSFMAPTDFGILSVGLAMGLVISFPIFILIIIVIKTSCSRTYGKMIFLNVLVTGVILTILASGIFFYQMGFDRLNTALYICSVFSAAVAICSQYKQLIKLEKISQL